MSNDSAPSAIDGFAQLLADTENAKQREALIAQAQQSALSKLTDEQIDASNERSRFNPQPLIFDFGEDEPEPDWVIAPIVARKEVCLTSGDTGAAKSISIAWLISQLDQGEWLGFRTNIARVTVVDEENTSGRVKARLKAMGMQSAALPCLRYFSRAGGSIGDKGQTDAWLDAHLTDFRPDLLVIDTLLAATATTETNSNDAAAAMMRHFRGLAEDHDLAIMLVHHERKQSKEMPSSASQSTLGARSWVGQSDAHITLTVETDYEESPALLEDDNVCTRRSFKLRAAEKERDGGLNHPQRIVVTSEKTPNGKLAWMLVDNEGAIAPKQSKAATEAVAVARVVQNAGETMQTGEIADALGISAQDIGFKRSLKEALELDYLTSSARGKYDFSSLGSLDD